MKILTVAGDFGTAARKIRIVASDFVPSAGEIGIAACVFGAAEMKFGTAERKFGTAEGVAGTAEMIFRIPEGTDGAFDRDWQNLSANEVDGTMQRAPPGASFFHRGGRMDFASPWDGSNRDVAEGDMVVEKP